MRSQRMFNRELVRSAQFLLVSLASATSNLLYIAAFSHLTKLPFWLVSLTSTEFSMLVNFALNDRFTFRNLGSGRLWYVRLGRFQIAAIGGNLLTAALATFLHSVVALSPEVAQAIAIGLTFFVNFLTHRFWTFRAATPAVTSAIPAAPPATSAARVEDTGLSVIIPARNEDATIADLLIRLDAAMIAAGIPYEALVVDDYSTDSTAAAAARAIAERQLPARVLARCGQQGKSYAVMDGFDAARYPALAMIDADLELEPEALPEMARDLARYDLVAGRRLGYGKGNFLRAKLSAIFNKLVMRVFLGINIEAQTGAKVLWRRVYTAVELTPGRWSLDMELIAKALAKGFRVGEHDIPFQKRRAHGNVNPLAVALELATSALRIKLEIVRAGKASAALRERGTPAPASGPIIAGLTSGMPGALEWVAPLALLYLTLDAVMGPAFFSATRYLGSRLDTGQYMWYIGWLWQALAQGRSPFVTNAFDYPASTHIMNYTSVPALGLLFGWLPPFTGAIFTYNLILVVNYALVFVFGKLTLRALGVGRLLSGAGGLLFCLMPYITAQEWAHLNLVFIAPLFIAAYLIARLVAAERPPRWLDGLLLGFAMTFAFYTNLETCVTLALCLAVVYVCGLFTARPATLRLTRWLARPGALLGLGAALLLTAPGALDFFAGLRGQAFGVPGAAIGFSADLLAFMVPTSLYQLHTSATTALTQRFLGNPSEWDAYLSIPFILLAIAVAARFWKDGRVRLLAHATLVMALLSLGPFPHLDGAKIYAPLPWLAVLLLHVPLLDNALPARFALYTDVLALLLVMLGLDLAVRRALARADGASTAATAAHARWRLGAALAALALVAIFWLPLIPFTSTLQPRAANILRPNGAAARAIGAQPTLILSDDDSGFSMVMGILAMSGNYTLQTTDLYGYGGYKPSFLVNVQFVRDTDGQRTGAALRQYLPQISARRVMFVSIDDQPLDAQRLQELTGYLGPPLYNDQGLVVIWSATPVTSVTSVTVRAASPAATGLSAIHGA